MEKVGVLDLFSGIGGFALGLEWSGPYQTRLFVEKQEYQRKVLRKHWPSVYQHDDIRSLGKVEGVRVVTGGFPCQPFSSASRGRKVAVDLWPEMRRVIELNLPEVAIAENVQEKPIRKAENDLIALGYKTAVRNIRANDAGAPHGRSRWWLIAHPYDNSEFLRSLDAETSELPELCQSVWGAESYSRALRVPHGLPHRVDRLECLGNAVVPYIPMAIGSALLPFMAGSAQSQSESPLDTLHTES